MDISPIGLQRDLPRPAGAEKPAAAAAALESETPRQDAPRARTVVVDLPDPVPGRLLLDVDRETGQVVGRIIEKESGRLLRQVPSEEALRLAASMKKLLEPLFRAEA